MDDRASELRRQAEHCRTLAASAMNERTRAILLTMAEELEDEARTIEIIKPNMPEA